MYTNFFHNFAHLYLLANRNFLNIFFIIYKHVYNQLLLEILFGKLNPTFNGTFGKLLYKEK